jgi:lysophospholipase L1-like esterase
MNRIFAFIILSIFINKFNAQVADKNSYLTTFVSELHKKWPNNKTQNLVFHGHSVPTGYYTGKIGVRTFDSYPFYTLKSLKATYHYAVVNCIITSIGGENAIQGAARFKKTVLNHKPDVLFIDYSLNDRKFKLEDVKKAWESMIKLALKKNIKVILLTPTPDTTEDILDEKTLLNIHANQVRALAATYKVGLVDSYLLFQNIVRNGGVLKDYMSQNNHPNEAGHKVVADEILTWFNVNSPK